MLSLEEGGFQIGVQIGKHLNYDANDWEGWEGWGCCVVGVLAVNGGGVGGGPRPMAARLPSPYPSPAERERGRLLLEGVLR